MALVLVPIRLYVSIIDSFELDRDFLACVKL